MIKAYPLRLPEEKLRALRHIALEEGRSVRAVLEELVDRYIEAHQETLELLQIPGFYERLMESARTARAGRRGKTLRELEETLDG